MDLSLEARIFGLEARILASNLGFGPQGWDLGLKASIWASRLGYELRRGGGTDGEGGEGGEISPV